MIINKLHIYKHMCTPCKECIHKYVHWCQKHPYSVHTCTCTDAQDTSLVHIKPTKTYTHTPALVIQSQTPSLGSLHPLHCTLMPPLFSPQHQPLALPSVVTIDTGLNRQLQWPPVTSLMTTSPRVISIGLLTSVYRHDACGFALFVCLVE